MQKEHVDFAIITIRDDEFHAVAQRFQLTPQRGASGRMHNISRIQTTDGQSRTVTVTSCGEPGPQIAQQVARDIISDFSPSLLLVVGIAGGVPDTDFTLGDVIVSSRIHDFSVNAYKAGGITWDGQGGIHPAVQNIAGNLATTHRTLLKDWNRPQAIDMVRPTLDRNRFKDFDLSHMTDAEKQRIFDKEVPESWQQKIIETLAWHFGASPQRPPEPLYKAGPIAASGSLVRDATVLVQWLQGARSIRAIEMESGGVFRAGQQLRGQQYPVMAIRGISDIVGLKRDYRWTAYACQSAAAFTYTLLTADSSIFENLIPSQAASSTSSPSASSSSSKNSGQTSEPDQAATSGGQADPDAPIQIYISYAHKDEAYREELETHLALLKRQRLISVWYSRQIDLGVDKSQEISRNFNAAQVILLLISANFMASEAYDQEMLKAMQRLETDKQVRIVPILVRQSEWQQAPFAKLQVLPRNGKPISSWRDTDQAWYEVTNEIRKVCEDLRKKR